jgi:TolB-like protein
MSQEPMLRRLSAILAADVVGYSRLMTTDEAGTLARFRQCRAEIIDPMVAQFQGRIVGSAGDSLLVEFASALAAVQCAVACQRALNDREPLEPGDRRIVFRMGINLGDVIAAEDTIHGEGVNVAARLEKLAEPGGLCISRNVFDQVDGKLDIRFTDLGEHEVKNIAKPIRVYRAELARTPPAMTARPDGTTRSQKVSIAVLPFDNVSGDPEQIYFSDGITEDIITELSRFRELLVIARNSSFLFRGKSIDVSDVARKLNVQFVVEGSVRKMGNRIRVNVQLIEAATAAHIWAERYDRDLTDVFAIQDEITHVVATQVAGHLRSTVVHRNRSRPTENLSAYDCLLRARQGFGPQYSSLQSEPFLLKAIELDPNLAIAHAMLAHLHCVRFYHTGDRRHLAEALVAGQRALDLDPEEPWASYALGCAFQFSRRSDEAKHCFDRAATLNTNEVTFLAGEALWLVFNGHAEPALQQIDEALRRDPLAHGWFWDIRGTILAIAGRYREAIDSLRRMKPLAPWSHCYMAICHVELGELAEAKAILEHLRTVCPDRTPEEVLSIEPYADAATWQRLIGALRRAAQAE